MLRLPACFSLVAACCSHAGPCCASRSAAIACPNCRYLVKHPRLAVQIACAYPHVAPSHIPAAHCSASALLPTNTRLRLACAPLRHTSHLPISTPENPLLLSEQGYLDAGGVPRCQHRLGQPAHGRPHRPWDHGIQIYAALPSFSRRCAACVCSHLCKCVSAIQVCGRDSATQVLSGCSSSEGWSSIKMTKQVGHLGHQITERASSLTCC